MQEGLGCLSDGSVAASESSRETRVVGILAMCPVSSELSIFQKKLEIQIACNL